MKNTIYPCLWFDGKAKEAAKYYCSVLDNTVITEENPTVVSFESAGEKFICLNGGPEYSINERYSKGDHDVEGTVKHAQFILNNKVLMCMDSSYPHKFGFNEAVSLVVECKTQEEIDFYWDRLTEGGEEIQCGWLKDKYGVFWQIVPAILADLMSDPERAERVTKAFLQMKKFDIEKLINT